MCWKYLGVYQSACRLFLTRLFWLASSHHCHSCSISVNGYEPFFFEIHRLLVSFYNTTTRIRPVWNERFRLFAIYSEDISFCLSSVSWSMEKARNTKYNHCMYTQLDFTNLWLWSLFLILEFLLFRTELLFLWLETLI